MRGSVRRSWLIVPAHDNDRLAEAASSNADVVVLDLQDTVHDSMRHEARDNIRDAISDMRDAGSEVFVRVDIELIYADLVASVWRGLTGIVIPGVTNVEQVMDADSILTDLESQRGVVKPPPVGDVREADDPRGPEQALEIHLSLDTGRGNWDAQQLIKASNRVKSISLGRADLVMDLRGEPSGDLHQMEYLMQRLIVIANALNVEPVGAWWRATSRGLVAGYDDTLQAAIDGRMAGFRGGLCMRARQVKPLNTGYTPSADEVSHAEEVFTREPTYSPMAGIASDLIARSEECQNRNRSKSIVTAQRNQ